MAGPFVSTPLTETFGEKAEIYADTYLRTYMHSYLLTYMHSYIPSTHTFDAYILNTLHFS